MYYYMIMKKETEMRDFVSTRNTRKKKKKSGSDLLITVLLVVFAGVFLFSGYQLFHSLYESYSARKEYEDIGNLIDDTPVIVNPDNGEDNRDALSTEGYFLVESKYNSQGILTKYEKLYSENKHMFGWLKMDGTRINYPVMFTPSDNEFYLHRNFYRKYSSNGTPFVDSSYEKDGYMMIIYGHNMNDGSMFHDLLYYKNRSFYKAHPTFEFDTVDQESTYEVIAAFYSEIYPAEATDVFRFYNYTNLSKKKTYEYFVEQCKKESLYSTASTASYGEQLAMFITCSNKTTGRFVVIAKRIY